MQRTGIELATCRSQVQRPNHYTTDRVPREMDQYRQARVIRLTTDDTKGHVAWSRTPHPRDSEPEGERRWVGWTCPVKYLGLRIAEWIWSAHLLITSLCRCVFFRYCMSRQAWCEAGRFSYCMRYFSTHILPLVVIVWRVIEWTRAPLLAISLLRHAPVTSATYLFNIVIRLGFW